MKTKLAIGISIMFLNPIFAFAAGITNLIDAAYSLVNGVLIPLAFAICLLYFFWGVSKYIKAEAEGQKGADEGKAIMWRGIVGLFIAFTVWGIIIFIRSELGIPDVQNVNKSGVGTSN